MSNKIQTIIVDDEINARENLRYLTEIYCPNIEIVYEANNVNDALTAIKKHKPQLVFLDIEMPQKNGFQLIELFDKIDFHIIFVTAYNQYALRAFKVSAVDYLLKPIDISELKKAVKKIEKLTKIEDTIIQIEILKENQHKIKKIAIPYKSDYVILDINDIYCINADRMYSNIYTKNDKKYTASKKLSYYDDLLSKSDFIRVHRSWIINTKHIHTYSKKEKVITLLNNIVIPISKTYKEIFEGLFK